MKQRVDMPLRCLSLEVSVLASQAVAQGGIACAVRERPIQRLVTACVLGWKVTVRDSFSTRITTARATRPVGRTLAAFETQGRVVRTCILVWWWR